MNTYYELIKHIKETFEEDLRVNNVVTGDFEQWKKDLFILVHLDVTDSPFLGNSNTGVVNFNVVINVLDIRDFNKEDFKDRFWHNDTRHDSWNDTLSILNTARNKVIKDHLQNDITLTTATSAEKVSYAMMNGLDGWTQTWTIEVPDDFTSVCGDCTDVNNPQCN
jgi:hypothetical protein